MRKTVFRPFWSYDALKTEKWLVERATEGYQLVKVNRMTRCFLFEKSQPAKIVYRIVYNPKHVYGVGSTLQKDGWHEVAQSGGWSILVNSNENELIKYYPSRDSVVNRNHRVWAIHMLLVCGLFVPFIGLNMGMSVFMSSFFTDSVNVVYSPYWSITALAALSVSIFTITSLLSLIKINATNKQLSSVLNSSGESEKSNEQEKFIVKRKFGWIYAPDLLEDWLEVQEKKGYHLVRVSTFGSTFYFVKGEGRSISYCVDYQNIEDSHKFHFHKQMGWTNVFTSSWGPIQKWTIWSQSYEENQEKPRLYGDSYHLLKHAKRVMITQLSLCVFLVIINMFNISMNLKIFINGFGGIEQLLAISPLIITLFLFSGLGLRTWLFYKRMKIKAESI